MAVWYHQFALDESSSGTNFVCRIGGINYELTTIPTGSSLAAALAQTYSLAIAKLLEKRVPGIATDVYIDNIRIVANDTHVLKHALAELTKITSAAHAVVNPPEPEDTPTKYVFLCSVRPLNAERPSRR